MKFQIRPDFDIWYFIFVYLKVVLKMIHNVIKAAFSWWGWVDEVQNKVQAEWGNYSCPIVVRHPVLWEAVAGFTKCPHYVQYLIWYNTAGRHFFQSFLWTKVDNQISCEIYGICGLFYPLKNIYFSQILGISWYCSSWLRLKLITKVPFNTILSLAPQYNLWLLHHKLLSHF